MYAQYLPQNAQDYITCFRQLASLCEAAMDQYESSPNKEERSLARLAENVETLSSLRGDNGLFLSARPAGLTEFQKEMYAIENDLRARLLSLGYAYPVH